eukprot:1184479-Prorocentrum_minimum.AAC.2
MAINGAQMNYTTWSMASKSRVVFLNPGSEGDTYEALQCIPFGRFRCLLFLGIHKLGSSGHGRSQIRVTIEAQRGPPKRKRYAPSALDTIYHMPLENTRLPRFKEGCNYCWGRRWVIRLHHPKVEGLRAPTYGFLSRLSAFPKFEATDTLHQECQIPGMWIST